MVSMRELGAYTQLLDKADVLCWEVHLTPDCLYIEGEPVGKILFSTAYEAYMFACGFEWGANWNKAPQKGKCGCTKQKTGVCWPTCKAKKGKK